MHPIETERLIIRNFSINDSSALHNMICKYQASEYAAYDHQWPTSPDEIRKVIEWFAAGDSYLAVCLKEDQQFIGFVCLNEVRKDNLLQYNFGYTFDSNHYRKGYAYEACQAIIKRAFRELNAEQLNTGTAVNNVPSCRLLDKLGFRITKQSISSFKKNNDRQPVEFLGNEYVLTKADWFSKADSSK